MGRTRLRRGPLALIVSALVLSSGACTDPEPLPAPTPSPAETSEAAPSGVQVAVVLPPRGERSSLPLTDVERRLERLADDRVGDVAAVRVVETDDVSFVADTAAHLADGGADLVCVLGPDAARTVVALADRFPATRFCAVGRQRSDQPATVDLFDVAHEQIGHLLGVAASELAGDDPVAIALGGEGDERSRRREAARAALAGTTVSVDAVAADTDAAIALAASAADADDPPAVVLVDAGSSALAQLLAGLAPSWVGPGDVDTDVPPAVSWSVRIDVVVGEAVDRLVAPDEAEPSGELGFAEQVFAVAYDEAVPVAVRDRLEVVADELARGTRDPVRPVAGRGPPDEANT